MKTYSHKGQIYTLTRQEPYTRKGGGDMMLDVWEAVCTHPDCSATYAIKTPPKANLDKYKSFSKRRCPEHKMGDAERIEKWQAAIRQSREAKRAAKLQSPAAEDYSDIL